MFDSINEQVAEIAGTVGTTPQGWSSGVFSIIVCVAVYAVLLCFTLFKTSSLSRSVFNAH